MRIKQLREEKKMSQQALGDVLGLTQQAVNRYENSHTEPDIGMLKKLANYFDVSVDYLVAHSEIRKPTTELEESLLDEQEREIISLLRKLPKDYKDALCLLLTKTTDLNQ